MKNGASRPSARRFLVEVIDLVLLEVAKGVAKLADEMATSKEQGCGCEPLVGLIIVFVIAALAAILCSSGAMG